MGKRLRANVLAGALCAPILAPAAARGWDRERALRYLEDRQEAWGRWRPAQKAGAPCVSCHSGVPYLTALRALGAAAQRPGERALTGGVRRRLLAAAPAQALPDAGADAVVNLLTLALGRRAPAPPDEAERRALDELWRRQLPEGPARGAFTWVDSDLQPSDDAGAAYLGAALAARALAAYPGAEAERSAALRDFLRREAPRQPLHHRLAWLASGAESDEALRAPVRRALFAAQSPDGGWTTAALGPWPPRPDAEPESGPSAYATAWAAYSARESGVPCDDPRLARALDWLERRQDRGSGAWRAASMNKRYAGGALQAGFMTDAATGYAAAALLACRPG